MSVSFCCLHGGALSCPGFGWGLARVSWRSGGSGCEEASLHGLP